MGRRTVYMDNNATTPLHPRVMEAMREGFLIYGNASSYHTFGREARRRIEKAREGVASFIGARPEEIIFMGSGSEANNTVLNILSWTCGRKEFCFQERRRLVTSRIEHPCIMETSKCLAERGVPVTYVDVDEYGRVDPRKVEEAVTDDVGLVSVMLANNEIGTIQDVKRIAEAAHARNVLVHTDAVQALGKIPVDVRELGVDFLSFSAHKIYGPKGVGGLFVKRGTPFCPLIRGGHQEQGRRAGTENTPGIIGLGAAVEACREEMEEDVKRIRRLRDMLREAICDRIPDVHLNGHPEQCLPNTLNVSFDGAEGEAILLYLDLEGIAVSTGSACSSGSLDPSHVLLATGVEPERAHGSIRFSLGRENTEEDVEYVVDVLPRVIEKLRGMSSAYGEKR